MSTTTLDFRGGGDSPRSSGGADPGFSLSPGDVLSRTFTIWRANFASFTMLAGLVMAPGLLVMAAATAFSGKQEQILLILGGALLQGVLRLVLTGAVTYGVFEDLRGQRASLSEIMSAGFSGVGTVLAVGIVSGLIILFGLLAFCVPGIILMTMYWLAIPVAVVESPGVIASLSRSADLTSGNRWAVLGTAFIMGILHSVIAFGVGIVLVVIGLAASGGREVPGSGMAELVQGIVMLPFDCLVAVAPVVAYHDLRIGKEGADIEELVKVFE
jgi:hypothetical protein